MIGTFILVSLLGVVISAVIGTLWYAPSTPMGKIHLKYLGMDKLSEEERKRKMEEGKSMMPKLYAGQMALSLLTSFAVTTVIIMSVRNGVPASMAFGFVVFNWLCFMVPIVGTNILWSNVDRSIVWKKFASDNLVNLVTVLVIAVIANFFA